MRTSSVETAILDLLQQENHHLKAHAVYERLQPRFPSLNPSTVYRALDRLASNGRISVSDIGTGASVYEKVADGMHHHLVCQTCSHIETIDNEIVGSFFRDIEKSFDFEVATNHLILFGECSQCRRQAEADSGKSSKP